LRSGLGCGKKEKMKEGRAIEWEYRLPDGRGVVTVEAETEEKAREELREILAYYYPDVNYDDVTDY
jgi:predicted RNase H-like HicB family nuclease